MKMLRNVGTPLVRIRGKLVKVERSMDWPITLGERVQRRAVRQSFMVARVDVPYNIIFGKPLLNKLSIVLSPWSLQIKFEIDKGISLVKGNKVEARRGCMMMAKVAMKQHEVIILENLEE